MSVLTVTGKLDLNYTLNEPLVLSTQTFNATPSCLQSYSFVNGLVAIANGLDLHFEDMGPLGVGRTLVASANLTYTLSGLLDTLPRTIAFTKIRIVILKIISRTAGDYLTFGPGASNGWTALVASGTMRCYGLFVHVVDSTDSLAVASGSNDTFKITNAGTGPITYGLYLGGNSG